MSWRAGILGSIVAVTAAACTDSSVPTVATVADSAGIRVVTNVRGAIEATEEWSLSADPATVIGGGTSPAVPLYQVTAVQPLDRGRIAVGTNSPTRALVFDAEGTLATTLGRGGDGPGEFHNVASVVALDGDSLAVWDQNRRRLSVFTEQGDYVREVDLSGLVPLSPMAAPSMNVTAGFTSLLPSESGELVIFVVGIWGEDSPETGVHRRAMASHRIDSDGEPLASYGPFAGPELYAAPGVGAFIYPFGADTDATMSGDALVVGTAEAPELRFHAPDGALDQVVRWEDQDRTVAGSPLVADFTTWLDAQIARRQPAAQALFRELFEGIPPPERFPSYQGVIGDIGTGEVWVGEYPGQLGLMGMSPEIRPVPARQWLVFGAEGELVARVRVPEGFEPYAVRDNRVWGVFRDELDVESVRGYDVVKG